MNDTLTKSWRIIKTALLCTAVVGAGASGAWLAKPTASDSKLAPSTSSQTTATAEVAKVDQIQRVSADQAIVPQAVADKMGLRTESVTRSTKPIPLPPFQGTLNVDTNELQRVHARFPGEIERIGMTTDVNPRELRVGDYVTKGQLLAIVWSSSFGEKKSELVDAIIKLKADEVTLQRLKELGAQGGAPENAIRAAEQAVRTDRNAVERAERTLGSWRVTDEEIAKVRAEADQMADKKKKPDAADWANVEVRATRSGTILMKNVTAGAIIDPSVDLFMIGDMTQLTVWAHAYEDDLPRLAALPKPIKWTVSVPSRAGTKYNGTLEQISDVIDTTQHTALVIGRIENPQGDLKIGQFVTVQVDLPAPPGELAVPAVAVAEDGRDSVVFVQNAADKTMYSKRSLQVVRRTRQTLYVKEGSGLNADDRVVTTGALLLREAVEALPIPAK